MEKEEKVIDSAPAAEEEQAPPKAKPRRARSAATGNRTEKKAQAAELTPYLCVQFNGSEVDVGTLVEAAKAEFRKEKKRASIKSLKLYIKPEEQAAYYVINEAFSGKVAF